MKGLPTCPALFLSFLTLLAVLARAQDRISGDRATRLKTALLESLNKYSRQPGDALESLGTPTDSDSVKVPQTEVPPATEPPSQPVSANPLGGLLNLFQPGPNSFPNLFNGILPSVGLPAGVSAAPLFPSLGIQTLPVGAGRGIYRAPSVTPTPFALPTLMPFFAQNGVAQGNGNPNETPAGLETLPMPVVDGMATVAPATTIAPVSPTPPPNSTDKKAMPEAVVDNIRDWRRRFYKAFKKLAARKPLHNVDAVPSSAGAETLPHSNRMQPVIVLNDTHAPVLDKNRQVLMGRQNPKWLSEQKVKAYARDSKGRIVRLFGIENSGYLYNNTNTNGFIPIPEPPGLTSHNVDIGPVYIPAGRPTTEAPIATFSFPSGTENFNPAPMDPMLASYVAPPPPQPLPAPPPPPPPTFQTLAPPPVANVYTVQMPAPAPATLAPLIDTTYALQQPSPSDAALTNEVDGFEYDDQMNQSPCLSPACSDQQVTVQSDTWPAADGGMLENNDKCNSMRLRYIIQESIVGADAEASKRAIQTRAESELGAFFNVVCGTGFFSYIAHTDEFCQASALGINCYVFSPVCSLRMGMGAGIAKKKVKRRRKKTRTVVVSNKN